MNKKKNEDKPADEALHKTETQKVFKGKINAYAFLHLPKPLRKSWGITKGTEQAVSIELTSENALIIRKN